MVQSKCWKMNEKRKKKLCREERRRIKETEERI
jgi:hypothetical protein